MTLCKYALIVHELALDCPPRVDGTRPPATFGHLRALANDLSVSLNDVIAVAINVGITPIPNT